MSDDPFETMHVGETRYYRTKIVKGGPYVPCCLWFRDGARDPKTKELLSDQQIGATIAGEDTQDFYAICQRFRFWEVIEKPEYDYLLSVLQWSQQNETSDPLANPKQAINLREMPAPF